MAMRRFGYKPGARGFFYSWMDFNGNFWIFGGQGMGASGQGNLNDLWRYNVSTNQWTWMAGDSVPNRPAFQSGLNVEGTNNTPSSRVPLPCGERLGEG